MLFNQVKKTIERHHLLNKGDRVIVGVSGGVDSMVLLYLLNAFRETFHLSLIIAHVNHGLRPEESEREANLVQIESARLGFLFEYGRFNVKEYQKLRGFSTQEAARKIRFHFFHDLLIKHQAQKIALGHNAEDQMETVLLRLIRGSGLQGLKGILPIREGKVIRPLLEVWRREIEDFAMKQKISFLIDSSNLKKDYLRNRIRLALIPLIEREYQPNFKRILLRTSNILREENDYLEKGAEEAYQTITQEKDNTLSFKFQTYQTLHQAIQWRVIKKMVENIYDRRMVMEDGVWAEVNKIYMKLRQPSPSFHLELPHEVFVEKRYDIVLFGKGRVSPPPPFEVDLLSPGRTFVEEIGKEVVIEETNRDKFRILNEPSSIALMDCETLHFPLKMRNFRPGDRFHPLGVKGTQKLKDFFVDHKIPKFDRPKVPLIISGEMIAWIVGQRIDERVKVTERTKKVLKITVG